MRHITPELAKDLKGKVCTKGVAFKPIQDDSGNWFISEEEFRMCSNHWQKKKILKLKKVAFRQPDPLGINKNKGKI